MGTFDEMLERMVYDLEDEMGRSFLRVHGPARADVLMRGARAIAEERSWPFLSAVEWVLAFGMPYDVPKPKTGLRGLIAP